MKASRTWRLDPLPCTLVLVRTLEAWKRIAKKYGMEPTWLEAQDAALTLTDTGSPTIFVLIDTKQIELVEDLIRVVIHESVHVWHGCMRYIAEIFPGEEVAAYTTAYIAMLLLAELWPEN